MEDRFGHQGDGEQTKKLERLNPQAISHEQLTVSQGVGPVRYNVSLLTDYDVYLFREGKHFSLYQKLGSHLMTSEQETGTYFAVWAPNAREVSVIGDFNNWEPGKHQLRGRADQSGIWEGFIPNVRKGFLYKYHIRSNYDDYTVAKRDPFAFYCEKRPHTASYVWSLDYTWQDEDWLKRRKEHNALNAPFSIYEVHLGSWRRVPEETNRFLSYRELAPLLVDYVKKMGFTHVEFLPVMEYPYDGSWGYQVTGFFAPTSRFGEPQDFMYLVECLHQNGIGVILDWVPSHFPSDEHGLVYFDGTHLFEHADPRLGYHPDWNSYIFNYERNEVKAFLISSALFWLEQYHADGLRVDGVASMLYRDYSRKAGEWIPNEYGGRENIGAITFLRQLNEMVYGRLPDVQTFAEESTAWPMVSRPTVVGGLGFGLKWNMGWMHDILNYISHDPIHRKYHHNELTFSIWYSFSENFLLPLSHDEVVHGKQSLIRKMPGDDWQKFANLRLLFGYMYAHPGKKLLFMGGEFAQWDEWSYDTSLSWHLTEYAPHHQMQLWLGDLNHLYKNEPLLHELDFEREGFEWVNNEDWEQSVICFIRKNPKLDSFILVVCNFTPIPRYNYRVGVNRKGFYKEILNSDSKVYGGADIGNMGGVTATPVPFQGHEHSLSLILPPLAIAYFKWEEGLALPGK